METQGRRGTRVLDGLLDHQEKACFEDDQEEINLKEKINLMQTQYSKMEAQYLRKVKELKSHLLQRTRKQNGLVSQIVYLKQQFRAHQEEIAKITEQVINQSEQNYPPKAQKQNTSPGLLKKSLQNVGKIQKRVTPTVITKISNTNESSKNIIEKKISLKSQTSKSKSPIQIQSAPLIKLTSQQKIYQQKSPAARPEKVQKLMVDAHNVKTYNTNKPTQIVQQKRFSTRGSTDFKGFAFISEYLPKQKPISPRKLIHQSPSNNIAMISRRPAVKRGIGNLKESMDAF